MATSRATDGDRKKATVSDPGGRPPRNPRVTLRIRVVGHVQGVSFRASLQNKAIKHRVDGWVRNREDGSVEAVLQGDEASVRAVVDWARVGPPRADVARVLEEPLDGHPTHVGFQVVG